MSQVMGSEPRNTEGRQRRVASEAKCGSLDHDIECACSLVLLPRESLRGPVFRRENADLPRRAAAYPTVVLVRQTRSHSFALACA